MLPAQCERPFGAGYKTGADIVAIARFYAGASAEDGVTVTGNDLRGRAGHGQTAGHFRAKSNHPPGGQ